MAGRKMPKTVQTCGLSMLRRGLPMRLRHIEVFNAIMLTGSVSAAARLINAQSREKHGDTAVFFSALTCFR